MLLIPYYTTVFRGQSHVIKQHTKPTGHVHASVYFCSKMPRTNVHCLTPLPPKRPVDVKRGKSEYVDSP